MMAALYVLIGLPASGKGAGRERTSVACRLSSLDLTTYAATFKQTVETL